MKRKYTKKDIHHINAVKQWPDADDVRQIYSIHLSRSGILDMKIYPDFTEDCGRFESDFIDVSMIKGSDINEQVECAKFLLVEKANEIVKEYFEEVEKEEGEGKVFQEGM